jgi:molybdopterin-guanine dinucleotide biosynthesis protein A
MSSSSRFIPLDDRCQTEAMSSRRAPADHREALVGAVLAGGKSSRMGRPKATLELAGRPLVAYPLESVAAAGLEPIVVAKRDSELPDLECGVVREEDTRSHAATGIAAALEAAGGPVVVVACDMPFVPAQLLSVLAQVPARMAVVMVDGRLQPLLARYEPSVAAALECAAERGEPLRDTIQGLGPAVLGPDELAGFGDPNWIAFNVNDRDDLAAAKRLMAPAPSG